MAVARQQLREDSLVADHGVVVTAEVVVAEEEEMVEAEVEVEGAAREISRGSQGGEMNHLRCCMIPMFFRRFGIIKTILELRPEVYQMFRVLAQVLHNLQVR